MINWEAQHPTSLATAKSQAAAPHDDAIVIEDVQPYIEEVTAPLFNNLSTEISETSNTINALAQELKTTNSTIDDLTTAVNKLNKTVNGLEADISEIK